MPGPWDDYATTAVDEEGPWNDYAQTPAAGPWDDYKTAVTPTADYDPTAANARERIAHPGGDDIFGITNDISNVPTEEQRLSTPPELATIMAGPQVAQHAGAVFNHGLVPVSKFTPSAKTVQDAIDVLVSGSPELSQEEAQTILDNKDEPGTTAKVTAGVLGGVNRATEGLTSPFNIATLGAAALPNLVGRIVSGIFAADMASKLPHEYKRLKEAIDSGDEEQIAGAATDIAATGLFTVGAGKHALTKGKKPAAKDVTEPTTEGGQNAIPEQSPAAPNGGLPQQPGVNAGEVSAQGGAQRVPQGDLSPGEATGRVDTQTQTQPELPLSAPEQVIQSLEAAANRARQRLDAGTTKFLAGVPDPLETARNVADWATIGAAKLARGGYDVAKWSAEMVAEFGDKIKPVLEQVYRQATGMAKQIGQQVDEQRTQIGQILSAGVDARQQEQASFGAALLQEVIRQHGQENPRAWYEGMIREFGDDVKSEPVLEQLYSQAKDLMSEGTPIPARRNQTPFTTGQSRITVGERTALKEVLSKAELAGEAGRKAGAQAKAEELRPVISDLREKMADSISKLEALGQYFAGQETGAARATEETRADAERIDRWLAADVDHIRDSLLSLVNRLPVAERGRFTSAISAALKRPALFTRDVTIGGKVKPERISATQNMYRNAAKVAARIEDHIQTVEIRDLKEQIRGFGEWADSPSVDVDFRKQIKAQLESFERLNKAGGLEKDALQAFLDRLVSLRDIGRSEQTTRKAIWEWQKEFALKALEEQPTRPVETRPELRPQPGENLTLSMRMGNWLRGSKNRGNRFDIGTSPIDSLMDLMGKAKATYDGWLFRYARGPVDLGFNEALVRRNGLLKRFDEQLQSSGLTPAQGERIGVYAQNLQEGGRQRLIDAGLAPEAIDKIAQSMTPAELSIYRTMRQIMDSQLPEVQRVMKALYNTEVKPVKDYFPMPRDWRRFEEKPEEAVRPDTQEGFDELANWKALRDDYVPRGTTQTRKGFTKERQEGAKTPIRIDAFDIFRQHINDVSYLIEMQPVLKQLGELGRSDLFKEKYGDVGQKVFLDWLDTVSRQGGNESFKRWKLLDVLRKNTSVGMVGFRLASQLVHLSNIPYIVARIGPWFGTGLRETLTDRGRAFLERNFAETQERSGSEPAQAEVEKEGVKLFGATIVPPSAVKASYVLARNIDRINTEGAALGAYMRELKIKGKDWRNYDSLPIDKEAQTKALVYARRAFASPLPKDVPQALSRGTLTGGNVSLGRTLFHFQNIFLDQYSNIRHDLWQAGIREKNPKLAGAMFLAVLAATVAETGIKTGVQTGINALLGVEPKKEEENAIAKKAFHELIRRFPGGGQLATQFMYGESGIPAVDAVAKVPHEAKIALTAKKEAARNKALIRLAGGVGSLMGIPGSGQIADAAAAMQ